MWAFNACKKLSGQLEYSYLLSCILQLLLAFLGGYDNSRIVKHFVQARGMLLPEAVTLQSTVMKNLHQDLKRMGSCATDISMIFLRNKNTQRIISSQAFWADEATGLAGINWLKYTE